MPLDALLLALAAAILLLDDPRRRAIAGTGLIALALGAAALRLQTGPVGLAELPLAVARSGAPLRFLRISLALLLLGGAVIAAAALSALSRRVSLPGYLAAVAAPALLGVAGWELRGLFGAVGLSVVPWALGLGLVAGAAMPLARALRLGDAVRRADRLLAPDRTIVPSDAAATRVRAGLALAGVILVLLGPHLILVLGGALLAAAASDAWARRLGAVGRLPVLPLLALLLLPVAWLFHAIAGPAGLGMARLASAPLSPAAQQLIALPLALVALGFGGLWPLHGRTPGPWLAVVGAALLVRVGVPVLGDGLRHWTPLVMPLAVLSLWWAAATRRTALLLSSASFATLAAGTADAARPGLWLAVAALIAVLLRLAADAGRRLPAPVRRLWWLLPAAAGWAALEPALRGEVFYTVLALLGVAAALRPPRTPVPHPSGNS